MSYHESKPIYGIKIEPSQQAQDLLAAFHLGAQTVLAVLSPNGERLQQTQPQEIVMSQAEEPYSEADVSIADIFGMDPLRREALLASYGLTVAQPPDKEPDPTAHNVNAIMEQAGVPIRPEPGGETLRHYEPTDEGEIE